MGIIRSLALTEGAVAIAAVITAGLTFVLVRFGPDFSFKALLAFPTEIMQNIELAEAQQ